LPRAALEIDQIRRVSATGRITPAGLFLTIVTAATEAALRASCFKFTALVGFNEAAQIEQARKFSG
jgi:hypothetical protein